MGNDAAGNVNLDPVEIEGQDGGERADDRHQVLRHRVILDRVLQDALRLVGVAPHVPRLVRLLRALFAQPEEVAAHVDVGGHDTDRVDVGVARVHPEAVGAEREQVRAVGRRVDDGRVERQRHVLDPGGEHRAERGEHGLAVLLVGAALEALVLLEERHQLGRALLVRRPRRRDGDRLGHAQVLDRLLCGPSCARRRCLAARGLGLRGQPGGVGGGARPHPLGGHGEGASYDLAADRVFFCGYRRPARYSVPVCAARVVSAARRTSLGAELLDLDLLFIDLPICRLCRSRRATEYESTCTSCKPKVQRVTS